MTIEINGNLEDISAMLVGAERYALGRRTYIVQWSCEFIGNNLHLLTELENIIKSFKGVEFDGFRGVII